MKKASITTKRLLLKPMVREDAKEVFTIWGAEENTKYMGDPVRSPEEIEGIFDHEDESHGYLFAVRYLHSEEILGTICAGPTNISEEWGFGYSFKKDYWGQGLATETVKAVLSFGIEQGVKRFVTDCVEENIGSSKVLEKCGLTLSGRSSFIQPHSGIKYHTLVYNLEVI